MANKIVIIILTIVIGAICLLLAKSFLFGGSSTIQSSTTIPKTVNANGSSSTISSYTSSISSYNTSGKQNKSSLGSTNFAACSTNNTYFYVPPIPFPNFSSITPLGWVSPGAHVFPSDHIYLQLVGSGSLSNGTFNTSVVAPGNVTIYQISAQSYSNGGVNSGADYSIYFAPCNNVTAYFHHVRVLSSKLQSNFTTASGNCGSSTINVGQIQNCNKLVNIKVKTGEFLGYAGRIPGQGGSSSLDFGVYDTRTPALVYANASRYFSYQLHVACPINYYPQSRQSVLLAKMGVGNMTRTQPPLCGQNDYDVPGTAQGNWFSLNTPTPYFNEGPLISLARSNLLPSVGLFSIGSTSNILGLGFSGYTYYFTPMGNGLVNRNFSNVTANGNIYCYGSLGNNWIVRTPYVQGIILLQLVSTNTLRIEYQSSGSCGSGQWSFTSNHVDFYR